MAELVVEQDRVAAGAVEDADRDRSTETRGAVHPQRPAGDLIHPREQRVERHMRRSGDRGICSFVVAAHVEHGEGLAIGIGSEVVEGDPLVGG